MKNEKKQKKRENCRFQIKEHQSVLSNISFSRSPPTMACMGDLNIPFSGRVSRFVEFLKQIINYIQLLPLIFVKYSIKYSLGIGAQLMLQVVNMCCIIWPLESFKRAIFTILGFVINYFSNFGTTLIKNSTAPFIFTFISVSNK